MLGLHARSHSLKHFLQLVKTNEKSPAKAYLSIVIVNPVASTVVHALGGASSQCSFGRSEGIVSY